MRRARAPSHPTEALRVTDRQPFSPLITSTDPQGRITFANTAFVRASGFEMA